MWLLASTYNVSEIFMMIKMLQTNGYWKVALRWSIYVCSYCHMERKDNYSVKQIVLQQATQVNSLQTVCSLESTEQCYLRVGAYSIS